MRQKVLQEKELKPREIDTWLLKWQQLMKDRVVISMKKSRTNFVKREILTSFGCTFVNCGELGHVHLPFLYHDNGDEIYLT
mmetsp:Transcript_17479/g.22870  ORF Transcript_17479/g.22870 Transcript_17479/m.22870 type:complete len:81 (+) Transcript_17479:43-285(+)